MPADAELSGSDATASEPSSTRAPEHSEQPREESLVIPLRESRADSHERHPEIVQGDEDWWYHQKRRGVNNRRYSGQVQHVGGAEGERIRRDLTAAIADLLAWAAERHSRDDRDAA